MAAGRAAGAATGCGPRLEALENRCVLAVNWDGGGDGVSWHDGNNWDTNTVPIATDDVVISVLANPTIQFTSTTGTRTVNSLVCDEAITLTGGRLNVTTTADMNAAMTLNGGAFNAATLDVTGGSLLIGASTNSVLVGPMTINGAVGTGSGNLRVRGDLTLNGTFNLGNGQMGLESGARLLGGTYTLAGGTLGMVNTATNNTATIGAGAVVQGRGDVGQAVFVGGGTHAFVNQGTIRGNVSGQFLTINPATSFANDGLVEVTAGTLRVFTSTAPTWTGMGTFSVSGGTLDLNGTFATAALNLGGFARTGGTVEISGVLNNAAANLAFGANTGSFILNGGTISGGTITPDGSNTLLLGSSVGRLLGPITINGNAGGGTGNARVAGDLTLSGAFNLGSGQLGLESGARLLGGTYTLAGGNLGMVNTATNNTATIGAGTVVQGRGDVGQAVFVGGGTYALVNEGTIRANIANQTLRINPLNTFTNSGAVEVSTGTLQVLTSATPTWTGTGTFAVSGGTLELNGTFPTAALNLPGFSRTGGTVEITGVMNNTAANLAFAANTGSFILNGGTISGGTITPDGSNTLLLGSSVGRLLGPITINGNAGGGTGNARVAGDLTLSGAFNLGSGQLGLESGARLLGGTYTLAGGNLGMVNTATNNTATIGAGALVQGRGDVGQVVFVGGGTFALANEGTIRANVLNQTLRINPQNTFTNSGAIEVSTGTLQVFTSATPTWTGTGTFAVAGGTLELNGTFPTAAVNLAGFSRTGGTVEITGVMNNTAANLAFAANTGSFILNGGTISGGTITPDGASTLLLGSSIGRLVGPITINGNAGGGTGNARVAGDLTLSGAFNIGSGQLGLESGARLLGGTYTLAGGNLGMVNTATNNTATIGAGTVVQGRGDVGQTVFVGGGTFALVNEGTIRANVANQTLRIIPLTAFTNGGAVEVSAGTLQLFTSATPTWTGTGTFAVSGGTLNLNGTFPTAALNLPGFSRTGGTVEINGVMNNAGDTLAFAPNTGSFTLDGGTINGGTVSPNGANTLIFGASTGRLLGPMTVTASIGNGSGNVRIGGDFTLNGSFNIGTANVGLEHGARLLTGTYTLAGGNLGMVNTATNNTATIGAGALVQGRGDVGQVVFLGGGTFALVNEGTIRGNVASQTLRIIPQNTFTNSGTIEVSAGTLQVFTSATPTWTGTGTFAVSGGTLVLNGSFATAAINLAGFNRTAGVVEIAGALNNASANLAFAANTGSFTLDGGTITGGTITPDGASTLLFGGSGSSRLAGPMTINGNIGGGSGNVRVDGGVTLNGTCNIGTGSVGVLAGHTLASGTWLLAGGQLGIVSGGGGSNTITIGPGAVVAGRGTVGSFVFIGGGTGHVVNQGTIRASVSGQTLIVNPQDTLVSTGVLEATGGGVLQVSKANWTNDGTLRASGGGRVNFTQGLVLSATSVVDIAFSGTANTQYGRVTVTGSATINGSFVGAHTMGYVPPEGTFHDFFTVGGTGATITGTFAGETLPTPPAGDMSVLIYETNRVRLLATDLADFDFSGTLDIFDFLLFQNLWDAMDPRADLDQSTGPGVFDIFDFLIYFNLFSDG